MSDDQERRRRDDQWHVGKAIDLSHILTTISMVAAIGYFYMNTVSDFDKRLALVERDQETTQDIKTDVRELKGGITDLREAVIPLVAKLEGYVDRKDVEDEKQWDRIREIRDAQYEDSRHRDIRDTRDTRDTRDGQ